MDAPFLRCVFFYGMISNMSKLFTVTHRSIKSKARCGVINTSHGKVVTPAFVPVGTKGTIKALPQPFFKDLGIQLSFVNTYHLVTHPGVEVLKKGKGIHRLGQYDIPLMSDSGGFQVFSLAQNNLKAQNSKLKSIVNKITISNEKRRANVRGEEEPLVVKISEDGVRFRSVYDGQTIEFTPEKSMEYQHIIGADLMMAFDECTYYPATHEYAEKAMHRTHEWLKRCIIYKTQNSNFKTQNQFLYGIIQGGTYEDLRIASARFIDKQEVDGVAIGGVSVGETKEEMRNQVAWVAPFLPEEKPVHLLGVGQIDDIIDLVTYGIDTFDCVEPTRLARMGIIYQTQNSKFKTQNDTLKFKSAITQIDIHKSIYRADMSQVNEGCGCYVCKHYTKAYLHHLFKQKEIVGYTFATYHNLYVMESLMGLIRKLIISNKL